MTIELLHFIRIPSTMAEALRSLHQQAAASLERSVKLEPGDRSEAIRFEQLHAAIDQIGVLALAQGAEQIEIDLLDAEGIAPRDGTSVLRPSDAGRSRLPDPVGAWLSAGSWVVELNLPHAKGTALAGGLPGSGPPQVARRWSSEARYTKKAMQERFGYLLREALEGPNPKDAVIRPSGITNSVLTEGLRREAIAQPGKSAIDLPVQYVDRSNGSPFPLRAATLTDTAPGNCRRLNFTLISTRHVEMDHLVHGAWFRNARISVRRPLGQTDDVAYAISRRQFMLLDPAIPTEIELFQTGFEPAILGFYRALLHHLQEYPGSVAVTPRYFHGDAGFAKGTTWATA